VEKYEFGVVLKSKQKVCFNGALGDKDNVPIKTSL
jgi:hypothetical protein